MTLDRRQIRKYIGMIKFEIINHQSAGTIMNEFRALIEKGGIVFIGFNYKKWRFTQAS